MPKKKSSQVKGAQAWRTVALRYPECEEGTACNKSAFKARKKSYLFLGTDMNSYNVMVKLGDSRNEAERMAANDPDNVSVGPHWITATFDDKTPLPTEMVERWIDESFRLAAPKKLVALLD